MNRLLLISSNFNHLKNLENIFEGIYTIRTVLLSSSDLVKDVGYFMPDCIVVQMEGVRRQLLFPLMDLREDERFKNTPMLLLADEDDT